MNSLKSSKEYNITELIKFTNQRKIVLKNNEITLKIIISIIIWSNLKD